MPLSSDDIDLLVDIARKEIVLAERETVIKEHLRAALEAGDHRRALELARRVAGLTTGEEGAGE
jgi:hypothetical protein